MQTVTFPYERDRSDEMTISKLLHEAVIGTAQYLSTIVTLENWAKKITTHAPFPYYHTVIPLL